MKKKVWLVIFLIVLLLLTAGAIFKLKGNNSYRRYKFAEIKRGTIERTISATGTLSALHTVEVGTQVSGRIAHIYADYNDIVKKGQLLAVLDTSLLEATLTDAEASYEKTKAQLEKAKDDYEQSIVLYKKGIITRSEFITARTNYEIQKAALKSAEAALKRAKRNLNYAYIRSPIDGIVVARNIEEGQTVAASFQAPTLFIIAEDLSKMRILAYVDESDIGQIKQGQKVRFTVEAYPEKLFHGIVKQIWLQPETIQNVVNYTVVIEANNPEKILLPGMTATIDFIIEQRKNVLLVPNTALRFSPPEEIMEEAMKRFREKIARRMKERGISPGKSPFPVRNGAFSGNNDKRGRLWYMDKDGNISFALVQLGATDGHVTEIIRGRGIKEGMKVITGMLTENGSSSRRKVPSTFRRFRPF